MDFLKALFNDKSLTYDELLQAINAHNGSEENKDNQIKVGNLGMGEYVSKTKYDALDTQLQGKITELTGANDLIEQLKKASKTDEGMQQKIADYETENAKLQEQLAETEKRYAFNVLLSDAGVKDPDAREFLMFKYEKTLKEKGESLELDENKHIKNGEGIIESLKTTNPTQFGGGEGGDGYKPLGGDPLPPTNNNNNELKKEDLLKMPYAERNKIYNENPEAYKTAMSK